MENKITSYYKAADFDKSGLMQQRVRLAVGEQTSLATAQYAVFGALAVTVALLVMALMPMAGLALKKDSREYPPELLALRHKNNSAATAHAAQSELRVLMLKYSNLGGEGL